MDEYLGERQLGFVMIGTVYNTDEEIQEIRKNADKAGFADVTHIADYEYEDTLVFLSPRNAFGKDFIWKNKLRMPIYMGEVKRLSNFS